jgi:hypothetical protein
MIPLMDYKFGISNLKGRGGLLGLPRNIWIYSACNRLCVNLLQLKVTLIDVRLVDVRSTTKKSIVVCRWKLKYQSLEFLLPSLSVHESREALLIPEDDITMNSLLSVHTFVSIFTNLKSRPSDRGIAGGGRVWGNTSSRMAYDTAN